MKHQILKYRIMLGVVAAAALGMTAAYCKVERELAFRIDYISQMNEVIFPDLKTVDLVVTADGALRKEGWQWISANERTPVEVVLRAEIGRSNQTERTTADSGVLYAFVFSESAARAGITYPARGQVYREAVSNGSATLVYPLPEDLQPGEYKLRVGYDGGSVYSHALTTVFIAVE